MKTTFKRITKITLSQKIMNDREMYLIEPTRLGYFLKTRKQFQSKTIQEHAKQILQKSTLLAI